jgi:NAD(P)-dependent dehydrogenase (short-subunit alcohol dehydrogenase family)
MASSILVAGATRGIGREFVTQFVAAGWDVHATARSAPGLAALTAAGAKAHLLDITSDDSIAALAAKLDGVPLDVVIANAGISGNLHLPIEAIEAEEMLSVLDTNLFGVLLLIRALKPNIAAGEKKLAMAMSSLMSSISSNDWGTQYCYRASKTALNATWRSLADEWRPDGIACVLLRPGLVKTEMSEGRGMEASVSVAGMLKEVGKMTLADCGRVIGFDGSDVPW